MKLLSGVLISSCYGHGRLMNPPSRSSLKRFRNDPAIALFWDKIIPNYQDHELFCGGFNTQVDNDYKCGVCGDNYVDARPRANELGGKYGSHGIIPRSYSSGSLVDVEVQVTAHHQGFFQFKSAKWRKTWLPRTRSVLIAMTRLYHSLMDRPSLVSQIIFQNHLKSQAIGIQ